MWGGLYAEACPLGRSEWGLGVVSRGRRVCYSLVRVPEVAVRQRNGGRYTVGVVEPRVCGECGADVIH